MINLNKKIATLRRAVWRTVRITSAKIRAKKEGNRNDTLSVRCHYGYPMRYSKKNELTKRFLYLLLQISVNVMVNTA